MSVVASDISFVQPHFQDRIQDRSSRRPPAAESSQPPAFATLLDNTDSTPPPPPQDRPDRPQPDQSATSAPAPARDTRPDTGAQRGQGTSRDRADSTDKGQPTSPGNGKAAGDAGPDVKDAKAKPTEEKAAEILGKTGKQAQGDGTDAATAVDASAVQLPAPSAPVAVPAVVIPTVGAPAAKVDAKPDAAATDAAAAIGAASGAAAAASAAANGAASAAATDAADAAATIGAATGPAGRAATDAAAEQALGQTGAGETKGQVARKGASGLTATAPSTATGAKSAPSGEAGKGSAPAAAAAGDAPSEHTIHADADPEDKSDPAQPHEKRPVGETTAAKPGETSLRPHVEAQATSDKPPTDAGQITPQQQHPTERSLAPAAAIQTGATAADGPAVPVAGLVVEIAARAQAGGNRFSIRLDPPELGRVDVRLDVDRDGNVTSRLTADKVETLDLLRRDAPQLERALQQAGLKTGDNGMQFSLRDQSAGGQNQNFADNNPRSGAARIVVPDPEMVPVETVRGGYGPSLRVGTGIDIRV